MFDFCFVFFLSVEVFGIAGVQSHFSYISKYNFFHWGSKCTLVWFAVCLCVVCCLLFNCAGDPFITRFIVCSMAVSGTTQNMKYSSVRHVWCEDSSTHTLMGIKYKFPWKGLVLSFSSFFIIWNKNVLWNLGAGSWRELQWKFNFFRSFCFLFLKVRTWNRIFYLTWFWISFSFSW